MDKVSVLREIEEEIKRIPERDRKRLYTKFFVSIISALSKRLIKHQGYSVASTILKREITELGKRDAKEIMEKFNIKERNVDSASRTLKITALMLGYNLDVLDGETVVRECPFAIMAKELKEPLITKICTWYCNGIAQEILGKNYEWQGYHDIASEIPICFFKKVKKGQIA